MPFRPCRRISDRMLGGVCIGLSDTLDVDVTLIRLSFVILALLAGHGILVYLLLWAILPQRAGRPTAVD